MPTLRQRIESRVGTVTNVVLMDDAINEALANLVSALPLRKAQQYASQKTGDGAAGVLARGRVLDVRVGGRPAKVIPAARQEMVKANSGSIYEAKALFPAAWATAGAWHSYPEDTMSITCLSPPEVTSSSEKIDGMPVGAEELAALYACWAILGNRFHLQELATLGAMPSVPEAPADPDLSYSEAVKGTVGAVSIGSLPLLESYVKPSFEAPEEPTITQMELPAAPDSSGLVPPDFSYGEAVASVIEATEIGVFPAPPSYSGPSSLSELIALAEGDIGTEADQTNPSDWFSVLSKLIENEEDPELAATAIQKIQSFVGASSAEIQNEMNAFQAEHADFQAQVNRLVTQAQLDQQRLIAAAEQESSLSLQNEIQAAQNDIAEYQALLEHFGRQVSVYGAEVQASVQEWQANELEAKINYYFNQYRMGIERYMADQQNELNAYRQGLASFQADVQKAYRQAELTLSQLTAQAKITSDVNLQNELQALAAQVQEYQAGLGKYQGSLQAYGSEVQQVVSTYEAGVNEYQSAQQKNQALSERYFTAYQQKLQLMTLGHDGATAD